MLNDILNAPYVPILSVRPAEMNALEELPENDKNLILPVILLRAWVGSHSLDNTLNRIKDSYGEDRIWIADIDPNYHPSGIARPVHERLDRLSNSANGYQNRCSFAEEHENIIPCVQLIDRNQLDDQLDLLSDLPNGFAIRIDENLFPVLGDILESLTPYVDLQPLFILDYGQENRFLLDKALAAIGHVNQIVASMPGSAIVLSATSFPNSFVGITEQEIFERQFFGMVKDRLNDVHLIYGDRGSARAERQSGGGGAPAPRIDYPLQTDWKFFRRESDDGDDHLDKYQEAALELIGGPDWDDELHIWGTQMIERTSRGDEFAIRSPATSTAARINIHLHLQTFFDNDEDLYDTEDEWED